MKTITIEPELLTSITITHEEIDFSFMWMDAKPIKRFFGLLPSNKFTKAGYYKDYYGGETLYTIDAIRNIGDYKVLKDESYRGGYKIIKKASTRTHFSNGFIMTSVFEDDEKAKAWALKLIGLSKKNIILLPIS